MSKDASLATRSFLSRRGRANLGSYYTPPYLVDAVLRLAAPFIDSSTTVMDNAAGDGAFLARPGECGRVIAADIHASPLKRLAARLPSRPHTLFHDNALLNVGRAKYGLKADEKLVIVGNPPYNDTTSRNRRMHKTTRLAMDADIACNDYGLAFLRSYARLEPVAVSVLHPLSYLSKPANFVRLTPFTAHYRLFDAAVFSSELFEGTGATPFAVVAACYVRSAGGMTHDDIRAFSFPLLGDARRRRLRLGGIETIDGYIRKYPPRKTDSRISDIGLYHYNFRDTNSLLTTANFTECENFAVNITVQGRDFYKYAYLNCYKRYFGRHFLFGNLSPLVERERLEGDSDFRAACVADAVRNNGRIGLFGRAGFRARFKMASSDFRFREYFEGLRRRALS